MAISLNDLIPVDTLEISLQHPANGEVLKDSDGNVASFVVYGPGSEQRRNAMNAFARKIAKRNPNKPLNPEEQRQDSAELLADCVVEIKNIVDADGKLIVNKSDKIRVFSDPRFSWLRKQIDEAVGEDSRFFQSAE